MFVLPKTARFARGNCAWLIQSVTQYTVRDSTYSSWLIYSGLNVIFSEPHLHLRYSSTPWLNIQFVTHIWSAWLIYEVTQYTVRDSYTPELNAIYQRNPIYVYKCSHSSRIDIQLWLIVTQYTLRDSYTLGLNAIYKRNYIYIYKYLHSSRIDMQFVTHRWLIVRDSIYSSWLIYSRTQCHIPAKLHLHLQVFP